MNYKAFTPVIYDWINGDINIDVADELCNQLGTEIDYAFAESLRAFVVDAHRRRQFDLSCVEGAKLATEKAAVQVDEEKERIRAKIDDIYDQVHDAKDALTSALRALSDI